MSNERGYTYLNAACTRAMIRATGMQARNMQCMVKQQLPMYLEEDFLKVIDEEGIGYNDVQSILYQ